MNYWLATFGYNKANYLAHHGILGQKWGIRRYQNKDGTLTKAGRERYKSQLDYNDNSLKLVAERITSGKSTHDDWNKCAKTLDSINNDSKVSSILDESRKQSDKLGEAYKQWERTKKMPGIGMDETTEAWHKYISNNSYLSEIEDKIFNNESEYAKAVGNHVYNMTNDKMLSEFMQNFAREHYFDYVYV